MMLVKKCSNCGKSNIIEGDLHFPISHKCLNCGKIILIENFSSNKGNIDTIKT